MAANVETMFYVREKPLVASRMAKKSGCWRGCLLRRSWAMMWSRTCVSPTRTMEAVLSACA